MISTLNLTLSSPEESGETYHLFSQQLGVCQEIMPSFLH